MKAYFSAKNVLFIMILQYICYQIVKVNIIYLKKLIK